MTEPIIDPVEVRERRNPEDVGDLELETLDNNYYYRWVHERPQRVARMMARGYHIVSATESGVKTLTGQEDHAADDRLRNGDTVLMAVSKARYLEGRNEVQKLARKRLEAPERQFRKKARENKVNVTDKEMK